MFRPFSRRLLEGVDDAPTTPEPQPQDPQIDGPPADVDFPGKKPMAARINALVKENEALKAANAAREAAAKKAAEEERQKKLAAEGDYKTALAEKEAQIEKINADFAAKEREWKLRASLAGMNDLALAGAIAGLKPDDDIDAYIKQIKDKYKDLFGDPSYRNTAQGGASDKGGSPTGLQDRAANGDTNAQREIFYRTLEGKPIN